jgi:hypothetical protein
MRKGFLGSITTLVAGAGLVLGQSPYSQAPGGNPAPGIPSTIAPLPDTGPRGDLAHAPGWDGSYDHQDPCKWWASSEYLLWWTKKNPVPSALVTTGSAADGNPGALGQPGTRVILGGPRFGPEDFSGVRVTLGSWLGSEPGLGIEGSGFFLPKRTKSFHANSDATGNPALTFRYLDPPPSPGAAFPEDAFQAAIPGTFAGGLGLISTTRLWGAEANVVGSLCCEKGFQFHLLGGFRYVDLEENLALQFERGAIGSTPVMFQGNPFAAPSAVAAFDSFHTRNQFYGGQVGARGEYALGNLVIDFTGKVALGSTHEVVNISGTSVLIPAGGPLTTVGTGQFATLSNIGRSTHDEFAVVPEAEIKVAYQFNRCLRAFVGYNFLYWSRVVRPGNQVDLVVDTTQVAIDPGFNAAAPRATFPRPLFQRSDFWAQGVDFGLEFRY